MMALHLALLDRVDPDRRLTPFERGWRTMEARAEHFAAIRDRALAQNRDHGYDPDIDLESVLVSRALSGGPTDELGPSEWAAVLDLAERAIERANAWLRAYGLAAGEEVVVADG